MKALTKTVASRRGGLAAQLVPAGDKSGEARGRRGRAPKIQTAPVTLTSGPEKPKPKFDRVAYQRDYMRERRAKLKAAKEQK